MSVLEGGYRIQGGPVSAFARSVAAHVHALAEPNFQVQTPCSFSCGQHDIAGVAHYIMDCFDVLGALDDAPDDASVSASSALAAG